MAHDDFTDLRSCLRPDGPTRHTSTLIPHPGANSVGAFRTTGRVRPGDSRSQEPLSTGSRGPTRKQSKSACPPASRVA